MKTATVVKNWVIGSTPEVLENIHLNNVTITSYNRDINILKKDIDDLTKQDIKFNSSGNIDRILNEFIKATELDNDSMILEDIKRLLHLFKKVTASKELRLLLTTIDNDMCRKFHVDNNGLRMLCTYKGPGTLWLKEDNINREALDLYEGNKSIVIDKNNIEQAKTGSVIILKGAKYSTQTTKGAVHRSPTIEESGEKRLLLRIDTN